MEEYRARASQSQRPQTQKKASNTDMEREYNESIEDMFNNIIMLAKELLPLCDGDDAEEMKSKFEIMMKDLIKSQKKVDSVSAHFAEVDDLEIEDKGSETTSKLDKTMKTWAASARKQVEEAEKSAVVVDGIENHHSWIELHEVFERCSQGDGDSDGENADQELMQLSQESQENSQELPDPEDEEGGSGTGSAKDMIPQLDPISKVRLTDPIRNKVCGHIYGKESMMQLLTSKKNKVRCPAMGCTNRNFINAKHLVEDSSLTRIVQKREAKLKSQSERK